jgi:1-acyl-sn-glycerol-3-phosphate acyltransferase
VRVAEPISYRSIVATSQSITWLVGQALKLYFAVEAHRPRGLFEHGPERCLILAPTHRSVLDPWIIMSALSYHQLRALIPVRTLATQTFRGPLRWLEPLIRAFYRVGGAVELPPKEEGGTLPEKAQGLLDALLAGDVVAIFPEGGVWKKRDPPVGEFAPGVVYLHRRSGAPVVPIVLWTSRRLWPRSRWIIEMGAPVTVPEAMDLETGAAWLRERALELYERASSRAKERQ